jgi:hypothetical protein
MKALFIVNLFKLISGVPRKSGTINKTVQRYEEELLRLRIERYSEERRE